MKVTPQQNGTLGVIEVGGYINSCSCYGACALQKAI